MLNGGYCYREQLNRRAEGQRVLDYLSARYPHSPREAWQARLERGEVRLGDEVAGGHEVLRAGQWLSWQRPPWQEAEVPLHFGLVHEDRALIAVDKPSGLPTMPGGGFLQHTLLHLVRAEFPQASPLHRLGRGTSGLVLFARTPETASHLSRAWREQRVDKRYRALSRGQAAHGEYNIHAGIGPVAHPRLGEVHAATPAGKPSRSLARVLERRQSPSPGSTLFEVDIFTGRPHQIRIHLASIGHPLLGDPLYGPGGRPLPDLPGLPGDGGYWLHAQRLRFEHPLTGQALTLRAPPPPLLQVGGAPNDSGA
ncbi:RluA family pseudouridine synthase [Deinococcus irradiatisoli]|uniref:RluA family pseudouridine synthase n=1 Tax=Deinococcus irradiatisoli TaxID=2202254 RepID=UPI001FEB9719|nr:RluA family pseudouridine synthase [Deinococcus irradiatisoli]